MTLKTSLLLSLIALSLQLARAQDFSHSERLPQDRAFVGDNTLHLDVTTPERPYTYTFPNMVARYDQRLQQFILAIPTLEPDLVDPTVLDTMTPEERDFLVRMVYVNRDTPVIIRLFFPPGIVDLDQLSDDPQAMASEVQMGGRTYKTTAQVQGLYQDGELLIGFSLMFSDTVLGADQVVEDLQLYAQGVRLAGVPDVR